MADKTSKLVTKYTILVVMTLILIPLGNQGMIYLNDLDNVVRSEAAVDAALAAVNGGVQEMQKAKFLGTNTTIETVKVVWQIVIIGSVILMWTLNIIRDVRKSKE